MPKSDGKITLERLIAAKRRERPSPEFWDRFQRELRVKERKLLQRQQPIENRELASAIWPRFRKTVAIASAASACVVLGFLTLRSSDPSSTAGQGFAIVEPSTDASENPPFAVAEPAAPATDNKAVFEVVDTPPEIITVASAPAKKEPSVQTDLPTVVAETPVIESDYTLDIQTSFEEIDVEKAIAFNEPDSDPSRFARGYIDPLSELGYHSKNVVMAYKSGISRVSAMSLDSGIIDKRSRWGLSLDQVKLKF